MEIKYKLSVLGSGGVGKSALTIRLVTDQFLEEYDPTIEDTYRKEVNIDDQPAILDICDTAGQEEFAISMQDQWIRDGQGFLLVYSIVSQSSFTEAQELYNRILVVKEADRVPLVLVGNKCDLKKDRKVKVGAGEAVAAKWGVPFFETSAKTKTKNEECFFEVVRQIRSFVAASPKPKGGSKLKQMFGKCVLL